MTCQRVKTVNDDGSAKKKEIKRYQLTSNERQALLLNSLRWRFLDIDLH